MQTFRLSLSILALCVVGIVLTSCKDDDEAAPAKPQISFAESSLTFTEDQGPVDIEIVLDKPASEDIVIEYELSGTAYDPIRLGDNYDMDFVVDDTEDEYGEVTIKKGETSGIIPLFLISDFVFEGDETINIKLTDVDATSVEFSRNDDMVINVIQEDGLFILLEWPDPNEETPGIADMDMFLWYAETPGEFEDNLVSGSAFRSYESGEYVFLPTVYTDYYFGLSYTYYSGTLNPLNFTVKFYEIIDGNDTLLGTYQGTYTEINENKWTSPSIPTIIAQTFENDNGDFTNFSEIITPESSSRMKTLQIPIPLRYKQLEKR